ncbi:hypothetical protein NIES4071_08410 [Calothrix sp. NIES-4071]|nr:hypothetical protein NIES4071_08410 [Calothrix sp. NIES-4071]BAZ55183.1 hypothetical protein NIES4105_08370 [Calothrix sp. NIES-4105]
MKLTSVLLGFSALLLSTVYIKEINAAEVKESKLPSYLQQVGISLFENNLPIYLDKRSIKKISDNSYVYTTVIGIDSRKSETDYVVNCNDISNVRLLRSRIYNKNEEVSDIEQVDKLVSADFQGTGDSDRYNANQIICSQLLVDITPSEQFNSMLNKNTMGNGTDATASPTFGVSGHLTIKLQ